MSSTDSSAQPGRLQRWVVRAQWLIAVAAVAILIAVGGRALPTLLLVRAATSASTELVDATSDGFRLTDVQLHSISSELVTMRDFYSQIFTDGKLAYNADALTAVYSPYSGRVVRVLAALGETVHQGQPLFELDASEYAQARSDLITAAAQVKLESAIEQRKSAQYQAQADSLQDWQQAQNDLSASQAALAAVRNRLRILGNNDADIDAIANQSQMSPLTSVLSPIAGVVIDRQIGLGQYLQASNSTAVYTVADLSNLWLIANVRETDAAVVHVGQQVRVRLSALPERDLQARITYVAPSVDPLTRRIAVHALLDNRAGLLKAEMLASLEITTSAVTPAPAVPSQAVLYEGDQARVWVMKSSHDLVLRRVQLGRALNDRIEVLSGLSAGERVVTRGAIFIDRAASGG